MKLLAAFVLLLMSLTGGCVLLRQEESKKADTSWDVARNTASLGQKYRQHEVYNQLHIQKTCIVHAQIPLNVLLPPSKALVVWTIEQCNLILSDLIRLCFPLLPLHINRVNSHPNFLEF